MLSSQLSITESINPSSSLDGTSICEIFYKNRRQIVVAWAKTFASDTPTELACAGGAERKQACYNGGTVEAEHSSTRL
ncbi:hypothetical protein AND_006113 [Anopheles darlingi]|uniref:Uncharacterized protein n=1 Tax=Anopheles darlingi TaxID=43151 RepID=W5JDM6_ANODA|nr:hypothetical protein AND_006113 [Anopheles darlingi]